MSAVFTEDEFRDGLTTWQTTPKYVQETERRGRGTRHTRPGCLDTECETYAHASSPFEWYLYTYASAELQTRKAIECTTQQNINAGPVRTERVRRAELARPSRLNRNPTYNQGQNGVSYDEDSKSKRETSEKKDLRFFL